MPHNDTVILVDEQDNPQGIEEKLKAHQMGLLHRAFSVCLLRKHAGTWQVLLQQRAHGKYHSGGLWTNTCCSHPQSGELTTDAAKRRLNEEMGIVSSLVPVGSFIYRAELDNQLIEHELDHVLTGVITDEIEIKPNPAEVMNYRWADLASLSHEIVTHQEHYTAWLKQVIDLVASNTP
ncbi:MAG: isopentenyl-diphosphate Delta-isomerase [Gammaproteobacteria bacterium]|nr:isopentenyl-diphosphate Delta-isomerase [Gammaproteobacteria bacterium]